MADPSQIISEAVTAISPAAWVEALSTLGPFLGVAAMLVGWQIYVIAKFENRTIRTWLLVSSSLLIMAACTIALVIGFINSN